LRFAFYACSARKQAFFDRYFNVGFLRGPVPILGASSVLSISGRPDRPGMWAGRNCAMANTGPLNARSTETHMQKISPFLWYSKEAEEAAAFYASIFPQSRITRVTALPSESPSGPPGSVKIVEFVLFGQSFMAMSAGPLDPFNHAISFVVHCDDQAEVDRYWNALLEGGMPEQCGWLKDRFGVSWQIVPRVLDEMIADPDRAKARRASDAMMKMVKIDVAALKAAFTGTTGG
jgi:predicted 3-demethylubiquinone-9 3-methyltransferase (glyoxalase superfamily)